MKLSRRNFLQGSLGLGTLGLGTLALNSNVHASISASKRKFIFLRVPGGWDTTRVFAPMFSNPNIDMEDEGELAMVGDLSYVSHPERPEVDQYFQNFGAQSAILNGIIVPNINHMICNRLIYTGSSTGTEPDWATRIAASKVEDYPLPHMLISGKALGGLQSDLIISVGDNGQLEQLLNGDILERSDTPAARPPQTVEGISDLYLKSILEQPQAHQNPQFLRFYDQALDRVKLMKSLTSEIRWNTDGSEQSQINLTVDLLLSDLTRCCTLEYYQLTFDSHENNDEKQSSNFAGLFGFLNNLISTLASTTGLTQPSLLDETTIVMLSEMGRTPYQNSGKGKEHWYHTSGMLIGSGIQGGRVFGGFSDLFYGEPVDLATGQVSAGGQEISPKVLGSTILGLGDVDPIEALGVGGIDGVFG